MEAGGGCKDGVTTKRTGIRMSHPKNSCRVHDSGMTRKTNLTHVLNLFLTGLRHNI